MNTKNGSSGLRSEFRRNSFDFRVHKLEVLLGFCSVVKDADYDWTGARFIGSWAVKATNDLPATNIQVLIRLTLNASYSNLSTKE